MRSRLYIALGAVIGLVGSLVVIGEQPASASVGGWHIECGQINGDQGVGATPGVGSHMNHDDVIKYPGVSNSTHLHVYGGNMVTDGFTVASGPNHTYSGHDGDELLQGTDTKPPYAGTKQCGYDSISGTYDAENFSSYWAPALTNRTTGQAVTLRYLLAYYKSGVDCTPGINGCVPAHYKPFPVGFQMMIGKSMETNPTDPLQCITDVTQPPQQCDSQNPKSIAMWTCFGDDDPSVPFPNKPEYRTIEGGVITGFNGLDCRDPNIPSYYALDVHFGTCLAYDPGSDGSGLPSFARRFIWLDSTQIDPQNSNVTLGNFMAPFQDGGKSLGNTNGMCPGMTSMSQWNMSTGCATGLPSDNHTPADDASPTGTWCLVPQVRLSFVFNASDPTPGYYLSADCRNTGAGCSGGNPTTQWDGLSGHADYFFAWNPNLKDAQNRPPLQHGVEVCINQGTSCGLIYNATGHHLLDK